VVVNDCAVVVSVVPDDGDAVPEAVEVVLIEVVRVDVFVMVVVVPAKDDT
jgi:hypothetical protein